jgi:DNA polymerase-3 subunit alpha
MLPDVNSSGEFFTIDKDEEGREGLRIGLAAIKTVGEGAVKPVVDDRKENGPYQSIDDFCRRAGAANLNRRTLGSMVKAGAFESLGPRGAMVSALDRIVATAQREAQMRNSGQSSLFGGGQSSTGAGTSSSMTSEPGIILAGNDASPEEKASWERELLGVALSHNPLMALTAANTGGSVVSLDQLSDEMQGQQVNVIGIVNTVTERARRDGQRFIIVALELLGGVVEATVWPEALQRTEEIWQAGRTVRVMGRVRLRGEQLELSCDEAEEFVQDRPSTLTANGTGSTSKPNGNGHYGNGNGNGRNSARQNGNGNGAGYANGNGNGNGQGANGESNGHGAAVSPASNRLVRLIVTEDDDKHDANTLREVIGVMLEYPGRDRVNLEIRTSGLRVLLDMPVVSTGYCDDLRERVEDILGPDTVAVSQEMPLGM